MTKTRDPICFDPQDARTVLSNYEFRNNLGLEGKTPEEIAEAVQSAYVNGGIQERHESTLRLFGLRIKFLGRLVTGILMRWSSPRIT